MSLTSFFRKCFGLARDEPIEHASLHPANKPQMRGPEESPQPFRLEGVQFLYSEFGDRLEFSGEPPWLDRMFGHKRIEPIFLNEQHWFLAVITGKRERQNQTVAIIGPGDWIVYDHDRNELSVNYTKRATPNEA